jgi:hypothetical protein
MTVKTECSPCEYDAQAVKGYVVSALCCDLIISFPLDLGFGITAPLGDII